MSVSNYNRTFGAHLAEAHTEPIGLSPCDAAGADGSKIIETQFKRFRGVHRGCKTKAGTIVRQVAHYAINRWRLVVVCNPGALKHHVSREPAFFFHKGHFRSLKPYTASVAVFLNRSALSGDDDIRNFNRILYPPQQCHAPELPTWRYQEQLS
jgi:hypothetical protein